MVLQLNEEEIGKACSAYLKAHGIEVHEDEIELHFERDQEGDGVSRIYAEAELKAPKGAKHV